MAAGRRTLLFFRDVCDEGFGGQHQRSNRAGICQCGAHDLGPSTIHRLREELKALSDHQAKMLKLAVFGGLTMDEGKEFDDRKLRIAKLIERLAASEGCIG